MSITLDARPIAQAGHGSEHAVTTAVYTVQFIMNEDEPRALADGHIESFAAEIQRAIDEGHFTADLRYDTVDFIVVSRIIVGTVEPQ